MWKKVPCVTNCPACDCKLHITYDRPFYHPDSDINANILSCSDDCPISYSHMTVSDINHTYDGCILDRQVYCRLNDRTFRIIIYYYKSVTTIQKCKEPFESYNSNPIYEYPFFDLNYRDQESIKSKVLTMLTFG